MAKSDNTPNALDWLLEPADPGVRYLALRDLVKAGGAELAAARQAAHKNGPIAAVLDNMHPEGYWAAPGPGYLPIYTGSVWSVTLLGQLGARVEDGKRIAKAAAYLLEQSLAQHGQFSANGRPSGTMDCLQGNLCAALLDLGCEDPRLDKAFEWMARSVTGDGIAPQADKKAPVRYYAGKCGPLFACGANDKQSCAWGAVPVMTAFGKLPADRRTPLMDRAIRAGVDFLFSVDPAAATWPSPYTGKPSRNWWKFGFPVFYVTDILQVAEALARLGYGRDKRLAGAWQLIRDKQDQQGRWALEYDYSGKTWGDFGVKKQPSKWVTLRALRTLALAK